MSSLLEDWSDPEKMLKEFSSRSVREKLGSLIDNAREEDAQALCQLHSLLKLLQGLRV